MKTLLLALLLGGIAAGSAPAQAPADVDTTDVYETRHYPMLEWPQKVWNVLVYPLGQFTIYAERAELPEWMVDWFTNEDETFGFFPYAQLGGETGTGGGFMTFYINLFDQEKEFAASYIFTRLRRKTGQARYHDPAVVGRNFYWNVEADVLETDDEGATVSGAIVGERRVVVNGVEEEVHLPRFRIEQVNVKSALGWRSHAGPLEDYLKGLYLEGRLGYGQRNLEQKGGPGRPRAASGATPQAGLFRGLGQTLSLFSVGALITYDDRGYKEPVREISHPLNYQFPGRVLLFADDLYYSFRNISFPERGGLLQGEVDFVTGSKEVRFWRLSAEAQRFFTLFWRYRILGLRARLEKTHPIGNDHFIPYTDLPTLGGSQRMRGHRRGFFRGEGSLLLAAEYRYPI